MIKLKIKKNISYKINLLCCVYEKKNIIKFNYVVVRGFLLFCLLMNLKLFIIVKDNVEFFEL